MKKVWNFENLSEDEPVTPADPDAEPELDESLRNPKVGLAIDAVRGALTDLVRNHGVTKDDVTVAVGALVDMSVEDPVFTRHHLVSILAQAWDPAGGWDVATQGTPADSEGPVYYPDAPLVDNPGVLPMREDEAGVPLIVSGQVRSLAGEPLAGAELDVWLATASGHYSNTGVRGLPDFVLRGRLLTDDKGRYEYRAIKPVPYDFPVRPKTADYMLLAQGFSRYRPRHIHVKVRHPDLSGEFTTQLYFRGDPYLRYYPATPAQRSLASLLQLDVELHDDPREITDRGLSRPFETSQFDLVLKTKRR
ncbi:MAG: hypothetical protein GEV12_00190 [Micromonosporaceae bacterium]|nr:hypothetical protein [Micromonosporaceae bacterium]